MQSTHRIQKRMDLVHDDEVDILKERPGAFGTTHQQRLDRLWSNECDALRVADNSLLGRLWSVTVPAHDIQLHVLAKAFETPELVVDERLQRTDVKY